MFILEQEPPSRLQARVLAALATWRMLLGELDAAQPLAVRAVAVAEQAGADAERAHGLATLGIITAQHGHLEQGLAELQTAFTLACRTRNAEDTIRAAANRVYLLYRAGRFRRGGRRGERGPQRGRRHGRLARDDLRDRQQRRGGAYRQRPVNENGPAAH